MMYWDQTLFLHVGWTTNYNGDELPTGGHEFLRESAGFERNNFKENEGWCYGYAPVTLETKNKGGAISVDGRTLDIAKLGAKDGFPAVPGITVIWTAKRPGGSPVIVGFYKDAIVNRYIVRPSPDSAYIAKARAENCVLDSDPFRLRHIRHF